MLPKFLRPDDPFTWASGIKSPIYCDNRLTLTAPEVRNNVEEFSKDNFIATPKSNKATIDYETNQDEYMACINAMANIYYYQPGEPTKGTFIAFPALPKDAVNGTASLGEDPDLHYIHMYHCEACGYTNRQAFNTCPNCKENAGKMYSIRVPYYNDYDFRAKQGASFDPSTPKVKGFYHIVMNNLSNEDAKFIYLTIPFTTQNFYQNQQKFTINGHEYYDKANGFYNWNDYVAKWQEYYGYALTNLKQMNELIIECENIAEAYNVYKYELDRLEDNIQDKWGDYIVEGKFSDDTICYNNILMAKGLQASEQYGIPEVTYNLNVIDSSGLIEYRTHCDDVYNDLVHTLHNVGQIVPKAGDYCKIYDEPMGLFGVSGLITEIKRVIDNPINNTITLDTSYTDGDELVGNIITATNTVLNNADIYARTAVLKADGTIDATSITQSLEKGADGNISIVGAKGSSLLDSTGLTITNPKDATHKMKYTGSGVYGTVNNGVT